MKKKTKTVLTLVSCVLSLCLFSCGEDEEETSSYSSVTPSSDTYDSSMTDTGDEEETSYIDSSYDGESHEDSDSSYDDDSSYIDSSYDDSSSDDPSYEESSSSESSDAEESSSYEPHEHPLEHIEAKDATCYDDGNIEYWYCYECDMYFLDEEGINEISYEDTVIQHTGHEYGDDGYCINCKTAHPSSEGLAYSYDSDSQTYTVSGIGECDEYDLYIPATYDDGENGEHPVAQIGEYAFVNNADIQSVTILGDVTYISNDAFSECAGLEKVYLGDSVLTIGDTAFRGCISLTGITFPNTLKSIGTDCFYYCLSLERIILPDSVTSVGDCAFSDCGNLASAVLSKNLTSISTEMFSYCHSLVSINIPEGVTSIGGSAFYGCDGMTNIILPSTVESIEEGAFEECMSLTDIFYAGSEYTLSYTFPYGTLYCYSEEEQTEGNFWHYVDGIPTVW